MKFKLVIFIFLFSLLHFFSPRTEAMTMSDSGKSKKKCHCKKTKVIKDYENVEKVKSQLAKLAPVEIFADLSSLSSNEKKALKLIIQASQYMDKIFLNQVYHLNKHIYHMLSKHKDPNYSALKDYFKINFGPFDRLNHDKAFINLADKKPKGANYYPVDMSKKEFDHWLTMHPEEKNSFLSNFTLIRRQGDKLISVPYSMAYKEYLIPASSLLKKAATFIDNPSLKKYLISRADAFHSNDYFQSDIDWVDLKDHKIEIVIGPYEVYEDELFGYKAGFESFVTIVDENESKKLATIEKYLDDMERNLPIDDKFKNFRRGKSSPILVVNEVFSAGDTKAGIQTTAFNLPNDERVRETKGSKKVMLKNIARAKFEKCWIPIVKETLSQKDLSLVAFDAYFNHVLMHEVAHGLGPGIIKKNGKQTTVNLELKELYSTIEEAKADILGIWNLQFMIDKGIFPKELEKYIYSSYLGGIFRSVRFGTNSAHGGGNAIQLNYLLEHEGFLFDKNTKRFRVNHDKIRKVIKKLSREILMIQALGDYQQARQLIDKYRIISPPLRQALDKVTHVPVDIRPIFKIEKEL